MRIVYVAGFLDPVLKELQAKVRPYLEERSVVLIRRFRDGTIDLHGFRADLHQSILWGVTDVLVCLSIPKKRPDIRVSLDGIIEKAKEKYHPSNLNLVVEPWDDGRDLQWVLSKIMAFEPSKIVGAPDSLSEIEEWAERRFKDKIVIHPRAIQGAKKSQYEDVKLVYAAIECLATQYWNMRTAMPDRSVLCSRGCEAKINQLGLSLAPSISESRAGEQGDEYIVEYPVGTGINRTLDKHLRKGSSRDERFCLRIYFFWDEEGKKVVVGWLPSHLGTRAT